MKSNAYLLLGLFVCGGVVGSTLVTYATPEKSIEAGSASLDLALKNKDLPAYRHNLSPDYTERRLKSNIKNRQQAEDNYRLILQDWSEIRVKPLEVDHFERKGGRATAIVNRRITAKMTDRLGRFGPKDMVHNVTSDTMNVDIWKKGAAGWKISKHEISLAKFVIDGKILEGEVVHDHHNHEGHHEGE